MSTSWLIRVAAPVSSGFTAMNVVLAPPMKRWSYSKPTDQFGAKAYSNPVPKVPPQRVELTEARPKPVMFELMKKLLSVTAAPPFTYHSHLSQEKPNWPVKRPKPSTLLPNVNVGSKRLICELLRFAQSP